MKFICNGMLGRLCKYLRICGIDVIYCNEGMKVLLLARKEGRIILTRNTLLKGKEDIFFIESESLPVQLKTIINHFALTEKISLFSRCLCCNEQLICIEKEKVKGRVPYYTYKKFSEFAECPNCHRVYWKGSHYQKMLKDIKRIIE